jgi:hypothetical protein
MDYIHCKPVKHGLRGGVASDAIDGSERASGYGRCSTQRWEPAA